MAHRLEKYCTRHNACIHSHVLPVVQAMQGWKLSSPILVALEIRPYRQLGNMNRVGACKRPAPFPCEQQNCHFALAELPILFVAKA